MEFILPNQCFSLSSLFRLFYSHMRIALFTRFGVNWAAFRVMILAVQEAASSVSGLMVVPRWRMTSR
jgi:hypothetical protein